MLTCEYCGHSGDDIETRQVGRNGRWAITCTDTAACDRRDAERERDEQRSLEPEPDNA